MLAEMSEAGSDRALPEARPDVLIVDDDPAFLEEMVEGLQAEGVAADACRSIGAAITRLLRGSPVRVVVTDVHMPAGSGLELLRRLETLRLPAPPVAIVITGRASLDHAVAALRLNAVDFLRKPVSAAELAGAIRRALALVQLRDERIPVDPPMGSDAARALLESMIRLRVERDRVFGQRLFPDAPWQMMLDLALAEATGRTISVTALCEASGVPMTTALRRLERLETRNLVHRVEDETDLRRVLVRLTDLGRGEMQRFLAQAATAPQ